MKIAYVAEWDFSQVSGVSQKILSQLRCWNSLGAQARGFFVSPAPPASEVQTQGDFFISAIPKFVEGSSRTYLNKLLSGPKLKHALKSFAPDIIYYRQNIGYPGVLEVLKSGTKLIIELNSLDLPEIKLVSLLKRTLYLHYRASILEAADGFCPVSYEIGRSIEYLRKPTFVCGNGIDFKDYPKVERKVCSQRTQVIFVGTSGQPWHGLERLNQIALSLPDVDFHIVGPHPDELPNASGNIQFYGSVSGASLFNLYATMDIGVGSLAISKKNMTEASPLKVREYGAIGLPIIYAYNDTDISTDHPMMLKISDTDNFAPSEINRIREFIKRHHHNPHNPSVYRHLFDRLDKERKRIDFFRQVKAQ